LLSISRENVEAPINPLMLRCAFRTLLTALVRDSERPVTRDRSHAAMRQCCAQAARMLTENQFREVTTANLERFAEHGVSHARRIDVDAELLIFRRGY